MAAAQRKRWAVTRKAKAAEAAAPVPAKTAREKRRLSPEGRARIIAATKKRWAALRKAATKAAGKSEAPRKGDDGGGQAGREARCPEKRGSRPAGGEDARRAGCRLRSMAEVVVVRAPGLVVCGKQIDHYPARPWSGRPACHAGVRAGISVKNVGEDADVASWKLTPRSPQVVGRERIVPVISAALH